MVPPIHGHELPTLNPYVILAALGISVIVMFTAGTRTFFKRVVT
jgi:hypothetical protein